MDSVLIKFGELKNEILQSIANTKQLIKLTEELHNSCDKYSKIKELFWKVDISHFLNFEIKNNKFLSSF